MFIQLQHTERVQYHIETRHSNALTILSCFLFIIFPNAIALVRFLDAESFAECKGHTFSGIRNHATHLSTRGILIDTISAGRALDHTFSYMYCQPYIVLRHPSNMGNHSVGQHMKIYGMCRTYTTYSSQYAIQYTRQCVGTMHVPKLHAYSVREVPLNACLSVRLPGFLSMHSKTSLTLSP